MSELYLQLDDGSYWDMVRHRISNDSDPLYPGPIGIEESGPKAPEKPNIHSPYNPA